MTGYTIPQPATPVNTGPMSQPWYRFFVELFKRAQDIDGKLRVFEATVSYSDLASSGTKAILPAGPGERWKVREIFHTGAGTNFSGGDRSVAIKSGSTVYSLMPHAAVATLAAARWGDTDQPFPATASHMNTQTGQGVSVSAAYSGGTTDDTAGSMTIYLFAERTA